MIKKHFLCTLLVLVGVAAFANNDILLQTKSLSNNDIEFIKSETSGGYIIVEGVPAAQAHIEVFAKPDDQLSGLSKEEIEERITDDYDLVVAVSGQTLTATAKTKSSIKTGWPGINISFYIFVPVAASNNLRTSGGSIRLKNLSGGTQDFATSGGDINVDLVKGRVTGSTSGGAVYLSNSSETIHLSTSGGDVKAEKSTGAITLSTSGGSIWASDISGTLKASTSGGNITLQKMACSLDASTSSGNVDVAFATTGQYITLGTSGGGDISLRLPVGAGANIDLRGKLVSVDPSARFSGDGGADFRKGLLNGGGVPVTARGQNGQVSVIFQ